MKKCRLLIISKRKEKKRNEKKKKETVLVITANTYAMEFSYSASSFSLASASSSSFNCHNIRLVILHNLHPVMFILYPSTPILSFIPLAFIRDKRKRRVANNPKYHKITNLMLCQSLNLLSVYLSC